MTDMKSRGGHVGNMSTDMSPTWCKNVSPRVPTRHTQKSAFPTCRHHVGKNSKYYFRGDIISPTIKYCDKAVAVALRDSAM